MRWSALLAGLLAVTWLTPGWTAVAGAPAAAAGSAALAAPHARVAGSDRITTAVEIARESFPEGAERVFLARADVLADALAAGVLTSGPVLLVPSCGGVPPVVTAELDRLGPAQVTALGGPAAVCDATLRQAAAGRVPDRLAGPSRVETAAVVARAAFPEGAEEVYLASSADSPDAVAAGSVTAGPILLVPPRGPVPVAVAEEISRLTPARVVTLGGPAAVPDEVAEAAAGARPWIRLSGPDRVATAAAVSAYRYGVSPGESAPRTSEAGSVYLARSDVFADAVAAGSLADGPVLLVPSCGPLPAAVAAELDRLRPGRVVALGGPNAVCERILLDASAAVSDELVVPDTTVVLDAQERAALTAQDPDGTLVFGRGAPAVQPGDVLVSSQAPGVPDGVLARVTTVTAADGGLRVETEPGGGDDAVTAGHGVARQALTLRTEVPTGTPGVTIGPADVPAAGVRSAQALTSRTGIRWRFQDEVVVYDADGDRTTTIDQVVVSGDVVLAGEMTGVLDVGARGVRPVVERFAFAAEFSEEADLRVGWGTSVDAEARVTFGPYPLPGFVIPVGPVTVPVNPQLLLTLSATGEVSASVAFDAEQELSYRVGAEYRDGRGWTPVGTASNDVQTGEPDLRADASATLATTVRVPFKVAGVAGPALEAEAYLRGDASVTPPDWSLVAGLRGRAGFDVAVPVLGGVASFSSRTVLDREWLLARHRPTQPAAPVLGVPDLMGPHGRGWGTASPDTIFNGGVPSGLAYDIRWEGWGQPDALGEGLTWLYMPEGGYYSEPGAIELRATDLGVCHPGGPPTYRELLARVADYPGGPLGEWFEWYAGGGDDLCERL